MRSSSKLEEAPKVEKSYSGKFLEYYGNGALYKASQYRNGLKEGEEREYALTGSLRAIWNYRHGKKEGLQQGWFIEGPKQFEYHFRKGFLDGEQIQWHLNGQIFKRQVFRNGSEIARKILFQGGQIFSNYSKRDGRSYGIDGGSLCMDKKKEGEK